MEKNKSVRSVTRQFTFGDTAISVTDYKLNTKFDDKVYEDDKKLWEELPRCFAKVYHNKNLIRTITGLRKFGDETQYKTTIPNGFTFHREVYLNKANGEYCSVSTFEIEKELYYVIRSKNVSVIARKNNYLADLKLYNEPRYEYVIDMANTFYQLYSKLTESQQCQIDKTLLEHTMNMEFCSAKYQHIVNYNGSTILIPFALTKYKASTDGLTSILPDEAQQWFEKVGLGKLPFNYNVSANDNQKRKDIRDTIFNEDNSEGAVVYKIYINNKTNEERVLHIYKFKNYKYIFWRAVREKIRAKSTISRMTYRLNDLHVNVPNLDQLIQEAIRFYAYCWLTEKENYDNIFSKWLTKMDEFTHLPKEESQKYLDEFIKIDESRQQRQIMTIGFPGSGKTTILKCLEYIIPDSVRINQDECNGSAKIFHQKITKLSNTDNVKYLLLDKCYHNEQIRKSTYEIMNVQQIIYIVFYHPDDVHFDSEYLIIDKFDAVMNLIKNRINKRGDAHLNLYPGPKLNGILDKFKNSYQQLSPQEMDSADQIIYVDLTTDLYSQLKHIITILGFKQDDSLITNAINKVNTDEKELRKKMSSAK